MKMDGSVHDDSSTEVSGDSSTEVSDESDLNGIYPLQSIITRE